MTQQEKNDGITSIIIFIIRTIFATIIFFIGVNYGRNDLIRYFINYQKSGNIIVMDSTNKEIKNCRVVYLTDGELEVIKKLN